MDLHYPSLFPGYFSRFSRSRPKVFVGEYSSWPSSVPSLGNALSEASFLIDLERNADMVSMVSYAPLFGRQDHSIWKPNLIWFDGTRVYGTPSYYVQQMLGLNRGDITLPTTLGLPASSSILHSSAILAGGTVQFVPGDLARTIPLLLTNLETHSLVRLTLDNPINGQLGGVTRVYYVSSSAGSGPPTLGLARFTDETVLYWADAASRLQEAVELTGAWTAVTNASSPIRLSFPEPQRFYRLMR